MAKDRDRWGVAVDPDTGVHTDNKTVAFVTGLGALSDALKRALYDQPLERTCAAIARLPGLDLDPSDADYLLRNTLDKFNDQQPLSVSEATTFAKWLVAQEPYQKAVREKGHRDLFGLPALQTPAPAPPDKLAFKPRNSRALLLTPEYVDLLKLVIKARAVEERLSQEFYEGPVTPAQMGQCIAACRESREHGLKFYAEHDICTRPKAISIEKGTAVFNPAQLISTVKALEIKSPLHLIARGERIVKLDWGKVQLASHFFKHNFSVLFMAVESDVTNKTMKKFLYEPDTLTVDTKARIVRKGYGLTLLEMEEAGKILAPLVQVQPKFDLVFHPQAVTDHLKKLLKTPQPMPPAREAPKFKGYAKEAKQPPPPVLDIVALQYSINLGLLEPHDKYIYLALKLALETALSLKNPLPETLHPVQEMVHHFERGTASMDVKVKTDILKPFGIKHETVLSLMGALILERHPNALNVEHCLQPVTSLLGNNASDKEILRRAGILAKNALNPAQPQR